MTRKISRREFVRDAGGLVIGFSMLAAVDFQRDLGHSNREIIRS